MMNKFEKIKPLIIGIGIAGSRHLKAQLSLGNIAGVYRANPNIIKILQKRKNVIVFNNLRDGIKWCNLVHVCTPDDNHTEFAAEALKKNKAVLCEKSMTTNLRDALYLQNLSHKNESLLIVGHNYRLTPTFGEIRKRVHGGSVGEITGVELTYLHDMHDYQKRQPARKNLDFLYIAGSHTIDLAIWVVNEKIVSVQAARKNLLTYQVILRFSSGLLGHIRLDANSPRSVSGTDLIIEGKNGQLVGHNKSNSLLFFKEGNESPKLTKLPNNQTFTVASEIKIVNAYLSGRIKSYSPLPDVDEAIKTIRVLDEILNAVTSGKTEIIKY